MSSFGDNSDDHAQIGFIGLGAMGMPMARHLATKLPPERHIYVFDVAQLLVDQLCAEFPNKVFKSENAREVAIKTVWQYFRSYSASLTDSVILGHYNINGSRRIACPISLP